jgi:hypothetical protein
VVSDVSFDPGVTSMQADGVAVTVGEYPDGSEGIDQSIRTMAQKMREGRNDHRVRKWAAETLKAAGIDGRGNETVQQKTQVLLDAVRANTSYAPDPVGSEYIPSAVATLCLDPKLCVKVEDCFPEGTRLLGSDRKKIPIERIKIGDIIWGRENWTVVEAVTSKGPLLVDEIELANESRFCLTGDHHVFAVRLPGSVAEERIQVKDLAVGHVLISPSVAPPGGPSVVELAYRATRASFVEVTGIRRAATTVPCWDIQTSDHYVYLPEYDVTVSNCDGLSVALGTATMSIGIPTVIVKQSFGYGQQQHVLIAVQDENGAWLYADPSTRMPVGSAAHATSEERFDPMDEMSVSTGLSGNEIVTLGRPGAIVMGIGAPNAGPFDQAQSDLENMVGGPISAGDVYLTEAGTDLPANGQADTPSTNYASAVTAYQAAGMAGATVVGPEIDLAGASWITQPLTHQAWVSNGDLQAITATGATQEQAQLAQTYIKNMMALWQQAINDGIAAVVVGATSPPPPKSTGSVAFWTLMAGGLAGAFVATMKLEGKPKRRR